MGGPQDSGTRRTLLTNINYGGANHHKHNHHKLHDLLVLKRVADGVLDTAKKSVVGGVGWSCTILDMAKISSYDHTPQHLHRDAPPYTVPEGTFIVNCLVMLTHNHEAEDGSHFLFVPSRSSGFPDPWVDRAVPFKRGTIFFFNALDVHWGSGIPKASPTGVTNPRLMAFFAIELTQGPNLGFPNLHVTPSINRPQLGAPGGRVAKTFPCEGAVRCRGKVVAKCYGCDRAALCAAHRDGLCVPCQEGEEPEGGEEEELLEDPNGVSMGQCAQCLLPVGTTRAKEKDFDLTSTKVFLTSPLFQRQFVDCLKDHVPTVRSPGGPPLWVVVHVMVKCIEGLYELWRVREMYTLVQVERHRALTTKFSKAWGHSGWSPTRWIHWCLAHSTFFAEKWRNIFQFSSIPTEYRHGPYKRRLKNCFKGWSLVRPSMSLRHMHHCMSMNALEQGLLGLEAARGSDIDEFV